MEQAKMITTKSDDQWYLSRFLESKSIVHEIITMENDLKKIVIGKGAQTTTDKFGRPTVAQGTITITGNVFTHKEWGNGKFAELRTNFNDKDTVKAAGARFDGNQKTWNIPIKNITNILSLFKNITILEKAILAYEEFHKATKPPVEWDGKMPADMEHVKLYLQQNSGIHFLLESMKATLGFAVGLGKTLTAITAANIAIDAGIVKRFAVIAPSSVKFQWAADIEMFSGRKAVVLDNSTSKHLERSFIAAETADFVIANYEMLRNTNYAEKIKELAGEAVIADEAHKIKNYKATQTKAWIKTFENAKYKWLLTATPFPNGQPMETYTMLSHVAPKLTGTWKEFANRYAVMQFVSTPMGKIEKPVALKNLAVLRAKMQNVVMVRHHNSPDVNSSMPKDRHITHVLSMTKEQTKMYDAMRDDLMYELEEMDDEQYKQNAVNILAKMKRLEQIALDPDQLTPDHADLKKIYPKEEWVVDTTMDHLDNPDNRGMVIFCDTKLPLEKIKNGLITEGLKPSEIGIISGDVKPEKRTQVARDFGDGKIKVVLATNAGEEGINLQHGAHTMIHMDTPWVPKSITQREGRILRVGQPNDFTMFYSPVMSGTIEETKREKLASKIVNIEKLLGEGAAGSAADNIAATAKTWNRKDMINMLKKR